MRYNPQQPVSMFKYLTIEFQGWRILVNLLLQGVAIFANISETAWLPMTAVTAVTAGLPLWTATIGVHHYGLLTHTYITNSEQHKTISKRIDSPDYQFFMPVFQ